MLFQGRRAAAGGVVALGEVLLEHPAAESGVVPGDFFALGPGTGFGIAVEEVE
jgi:hypothetical protein